MSQNGHFHAARPVLPWRRTHVETRVLGPPLTTREREVAQLIGRGLTNRQIADELGISDRTVGAHVQNILNKLGATNRAQIAAWAASRPDTPRVRVGPSVPVAAPILPSRVPMLGLSPTIQLALVVLAAVVLTVAFPADHLISQPWAAAAVAGQRGELVYEAHFDPNAGEFSPRYAIGDPSASDIRFVNGGIEYSVLKSGGNTGNGTVMPTMSAFFGEFELTVSRGSSVQFWIVFNTDETQHLLNIDTAVESMQLNYFVNGNSTSAALGRPVTIDGLQAGRKVSISVLVQPPMYRVFLDGVRVIDLTHQGPRGHMAPAFGTFGERGTVTLSAVRVYTVA